jgi:hypothetical protein
MNAELPKARCQVKYQLRTPAKRTQALSRARPSMADGDEAPTITDSEEAAWAKDQRTLVETYLQVQGCDHAGVSLEPRWYLSRYLAVWAVRSKANPDLVGWWAISGASRPTI